MKSSASYESQEFSGERRQEIAWVMQGVGAALLASFLLDLALQAWPLALFKPAWLDQMTGVLVNRGLTPLTGSLLVAAAPVVNGQSDRLANRAQLLRRFASWVAIGYLLLIPLQLYAGVQLLREQNQQTAQVLAQASRSSRAIQAATSEAELRQAYELIPGRKAPLPDTLPTPLSLVKDRLLATLEARNKKEEYDRDQRMAALGNQAVEVLFGNTLRALILAAGFAAVGRRSPAHQTLLRSLLSNNGRLPGQGKRRSRAPFKGRWP